MSLSSHRRASRTTPGRARAAAAAVGICAAVAATAGAVTPAAAAPTASAAPAAAAASAAPTASPWHVVASGLNNPRQLGWYDGSLFVAEAGKGGTGTCVANPEGGDRCFGPSGAVTRVRAGQQSRVVTGLPSLAPADGSNATGPTDIDVQGKRYVLSLGIGGTTAVRSTLPPRGRFLGTLTKGTFGQPGLTTLADVAAYEERANPDGKQVDSNPVGLLRQGPRYIVADAGANAVVSTTGGSQFATRAVFPTRDVLAPPFLGLPPGTMIPMDAVPTSTAYGQDGALYVSQLTGFPFPVGASTIWRVVRGQAPTAYATGLTNVTDLAFASDGSLYAVQIAAGGLLAGPVGSVVRIPPGGGATHTTVAADLFAPYGISLRNHMAYVTTCSVCAGGGQVIRIPVS